MAEDDRDKPANNTGVILFTSCVCAREVIEIPLVRLQTVDLDRKTVDGCLRLSERIGKVPFPLGFDDRIGDFLKLSEVTFKESKKDLSNRDRTLTQHAR